MSRDKHTELEPHLKHGAGRSSIQPADVKQRSKTNGQRRGSRYSRSIIRSCADISLPCSLAFYVLRMVLKHNFLKLLKKLFCSPHFCKAVIVSIKLCLRDGEFTNKCFLRAN